MRALEVPRDSEHRHYVDFLADFSGMFHEQLDASEREGLFAARSHSRVLRGVSGFSSQIPAKRLDSLQSKTICREFVGELSLRSSGSRFKSRCPGLILS
jgi:hypothetical protein